jgi:hypothetical protein
LNEKEPDARIALGPRDHFPFDPTGAPVISLRISAIFSRPLKYR